MNSEHFRFGAKQEPSKIIKNQDSKKLMQEYLANGGKINEIATGKSIENSGEVIIGRGGDLINIKTYDIKNCAKKQKARVKLRESACDYLSNINK